jgi:hypothetical protein
VLDAVEPPAYVRQFAVHSGRDGCRIVTIFVICGGRVTGCGLEIVSAGGLILRLSDARFGDMCLLPSRAGELSQSEEKVELRAPYVGC